jgi:hypothetical protein
MCSYCGERKPAAKCVALCHSGNSSRCDRVETDDGVLLLCQPCLDDLQVACTEIVLCWLTVCACVCLTRPATSPKRRPRHPPARWLVRVV